MIDRMLHLLQALSKFWLNDDVQYDACANSRSWYIRFEGSIFGTFDCFTIQKFSQKKEQDN